VTFKIVIPARYASTRLPAKPLLDISGRPMIQWVIAASKRTRADEVLVATDDERVALAAKECAVMTRSDHASGTDRIAEVAASKGWSDATIVVNVQGDEPQLPPEIIDQVASLLEQQPDADIATLCTPISTLEEFLDPNAVKVVSDSNGAALYFSRAPIPWNRDGAPRGLTSQSSFTGAYRHLGIYAYRVAALREMSQTPPSDLERTEKLEQLRALQMGMRVAVAVATIAPPAGIDTPEDLERVRATLTAG
jgi:3-deoxy-manno-octulosonate cytidylyltransferase (CMP-KDO synthetase)